MPPTPESGKANCQEKINPLPKVQQKQPHLPRRRASSCGESLAERYRGPSSWQSWDIQQVLALALAGMWGGSRPRGGIRVSKQDTGT